MSGAVKDELIHGADIGSRKYLLNDHRPHDPGLLPQVVCAGFEDCLEQYRVERDDFQYSCVEFVAGGRGHVVLHEKSYVLTAGTFFFYGPGIPHRISTATGQTMRKYFVDYIDHATPGAFTPATLRSGPVYTGEVDFFENLLNVILTYGQPEFRQKDRVTAEAMRLIFSMLESRAHFTDPEVSPAYATYQHVRSFLDRNWRELFYTRDLARALNVDQSYMCRLFQRFAHTTPHRYLAGLKMRKAGELLIGADRSIKDVATYLGYSNQYHFARVFKKYHGVPPGEFMEKWKYRR